MLTLRWEHNFGKGKLYQNIKGVRLILVALVVRDSIFSFFMRSYNNLWDEFVSKENFEIACNKSMKNKKSQRQVRAFLKNKDANLEQIRQMVINGQFHTSKYVSKTIYEPKERVIYKLPYNPDRIVQHAVMNVLQPILVNLMIDNSYACIEGRGQLKASIKCAEYVRKNEYCLKCDIRKFYPSINQEILSKKLHRIIKDKRFMAIVDDIIFSFEGGYNCPIGNYCSQWFGNYYLTFLDNYVLHQLKPRGYERYCDDFMLFDNDKKFLHECKEKLVVFLRDELELEFSKAEVFNVKQGVDFVGYRHFKKYVLVRKSTAKRIKKRFKGIEAQLDNGHNLNIPRLQGQVASGRGVLRHACSYRLRNKVKLEELTERITRLAVS